MAETFAWQHRAAPTGSIKHRTLSASFGDGYTQRAGDGINSKGVEWPLEFVGPRSVIDPIAGFLDTHGGYMAFSWTPPLGVPGMFVATDGYTVTPNGRGVVTLAVTFRQEFRP